MMCITQAEDRWPFRLPAILVGDGRLGGISGTISAYESLRLRGYDVAAIIFEDHNLGNEVPLLSYLRNRVPVLVLPPVPRGISENLIEWFEKSSSVFCSLKEIMLTTFLERIQRLHDMPKKAREIFWWPFTQHKLVPDETVTVIDSRFGENFAVHKVQHDSIIQQFDACASWWTQGPDATLQVVFRSFSSEEHDVGLPFGSAIKRDVLVYCGHNIHTRPIEYHQLCGNVVKFPSLLCHIFRWLQIELAKDMGYTAARFGHVMFPENVYEPALECAEHLLEGVGKDNGSTAIEIALKMAFRKFLLDHETILDLQSAEMGERRLELKVGPCSYL
ncbi:hypothetical protein RJ639_027572 [Escallonia herrerae]|uniref:Uncharacterized protein n=1 Tax=Escallonia herrerae TaxID=1293975 RepID=A0AA88XLY1_9ASTE|nr:hypothetical protein RJ639_027572 [Escallonia herrerae]